MTGRCDVSRCEGSSDTCIGESVNGWEVSIMTESCGVVAVER